VLAVVGDWFDMMQFFACLLLRCCFSILCVLGLWVWQLLVFWDFGFWVFWYFAYSWFWVVSGVGFGLYNINSGVLLFWWVL